MTTSSRSRAADPCPSWCEDHQVIEDDYAGEAVQITSHALGLIGVRGQGGRLLFSARLSQVDIGREGDMPPVSGGPQLTLAETGSATGGWTLTPSQARDLAAALLEGADRVDAELTAVCAVCGARVHQAAAEACVTCRVRMANASGPLLTAIRGGAL